MKTDKNKQFREYVSEAQKIVKLLRLKNVHRIKVAEIALKAAVLINGGRAPITRNTVKSFSDKIGVNNKTLYEWIRYKKLVYDKLDRARKDSYNELSMDTIKHITKGIKRQTPAKTVQKRYDQFYKRSSIETRMHKYISHLRTVLYNCSNHGRMMEIPDSILLEVLGTCRKISGYIELEMKNRGAEIPKKYKKPAINPNLFWEDQIGVN